jgi:NNP family nitrate/nitrite transporter-like MFS transporter
VTGKAERIQLFSLASPQMRAFHMTWFAFFTVFFAWFAIAPLMPLVRADLGLTQAQIANTVIASVLGTVFMRILIGPLCDRYGARLTYAALLIVGSIPVMAIGLAQSYWAFLLLRLAIGGIGAAFVITQYHTSVMFAPRCVGTATATTAGWGNLGGGVTQIAMPLILGGLLALGVSEAIGWRVAMVAPGLLMLLAGLAYLRFTQDSPEGNYRELRAAGRLGHAPRGSGWASLVEAARDARVWILFLVYAACFGIELTIHNVAALYFHDRFALGLEGAGLVAGLFGLMSIFARTLGGFLSDRSSHRWGAPGRVRLLFWLVLAEGASLMWFARMDLLPLAIAALLVFSVFVKMAEGATYGLVPFVNRAALGSVAGIVGAGGNVGAVAAGFMFRSESLAYEQVFFVFGVVITLVSGVTLLMRFPAESPPTKVAHAQPVTVHQVPAHPVTADVAFARTG